MPRGNKPTREEARRARERAAEEEEDGYEEDAHRSREMAMTRERAMRRARVDTLQRVLPFVLANSEPEHQALCFRACKTWKVVMEAQGVCRRTLPLCAALAQDNTNQRKRLSMSFTYVKDLTWAARMAFPLDASAFLQRWWGTFSHPITPPRGTLREWLQAASQEPDASFLSNGAASTALALGLPLIHWVGKPQGRFANGVAAFEGHSSEVSAVAFSPDGKRIVTGSTQGRLKIWDAATGAEVSSSAGLR